MREAANDKRSTGFFDIGGTGEFQVMILGGGGCAEHEWGIDRLLSGFRVDPKSAPGITRRMIGKDFGYNNGIVVISDIGTKKHPESIMYVGMKSAVKIFLGSTETVESNIPGCFVIPKEKLNLESIDKFFPRMNYYHNTETNKFTPLKKRASLKERDMWMNENAGILGSWSGHEFAVRAIGPEACANLHAVFEAFEVGNIAFTISSSPNPFSRPGLCISLTDRLTDEMKEEIVLIDRITDLKEIVCKNIIDLISNKRKDTYGISISYDFSPEALEKIKENIDFIPTKDDVEIRIFAYADKRSQINDGTYTYNDVYAFLTDQDNPIKNTEQTEEPAP